MKQTIVAMAACLAIFAQDTWAQTTNSTLTARPIQMVSCASLPDGIAFNVKPMGHETGFEVYYLVTGNGFAAFKKDSLVMTTMKTKDGVDISRNRMGRPSYKQGFFPKISEDGRYAVFSVKVDQEHFGKVESLSMQGSIVVLAASQREEQSLVLSTTANAPQTSGPFTVTPQAGGKPMMGMMGADSFGVKIQGPLSSIIDVELVAGGSAEKSRSSMSDASSTTFFFKKPTTSSVTLRINSWKDLTEHTVSFGQ